MLCFVVFVCHDRYFEDVRRGVMARLGRLSNDELAADEDAVMAIMSSLGVVMSAIDVKFNVGGQQYTPLFMFGSLVSDMYVHTCVVFRPWLSVVLCSSVLPGMM